MAALTDFGFGQAGIPLESFEHEGTAIHLGAEPNRIDLHTSISAIDNDSVFKNLQRVEYEGVCMNIISKPDLIASKRGSTRLKDQADAEELDNLEKEPND